MLALPASADIFFSNFLAPIAMALCIMIDVEVELDLEAMLYCTAEVPTV